MAGVTTSIAREAEWVELGGREFPGTIKEKAVYRVSALSPNLMFGVHNNNLCNLRRGLVERVFCVETPGGLARPPAPIPGIFEERMAPFRHALRRRVEETTPISHDEFVDLYKGRRHTIYSAAADSLMTEPVTRRDAILTTFLKAEKIDFTKKGDPAPRVIQPRSPRFNVEVGRYIKHIEHDLYRGINAVFNDGHTIMKGLNARRSGGVMESKWNRFKRPVAIGLDASRFDQHVSVDALRWEHLCYGLYYTGSERAELMRLLEWQITNKGVARASNGIITYKVKGCRMSGDMNTGLGNCLLMCAMIWTYCKEHGIKDYELANNGDDCVLIMDTKDLARTANIPTWFREMGFTMKVEEPVYELEHIEFCQTHPVWTPEGYIMVRKHGVAMAKDCISLKPLDSKGAFDKWRKCVGEAGMSLTGGIPVQQEFYAAFMRGTSSAGNMNKDPVMETGFMRLAAGMNRKYTEVHPRTRLSYYIAYGITPDEQEALEGIYKGTILTYSAPEPEGIHPNNPPHLDL